MNLQNMTINLMQVVGFVMLGLFVVELFVRTGLMIYKAIRGKKW